MLVKVNGETRELTASTTIAELLGELGYSNAFVAVAVNHACVPRASYGSTEVADHDEIEILAPMAGG